MSSETLSYFFKNEDIKLKARFQVALQCAPFLKGDQDIQRDHNGTENVRSLQEILKRQR